MADTKVTTERELVGDPRTRNPREKRPFSSSRVSSRAHFRAYSPYVLSELLQGIVLGLEELKKETNNRQSTVPKWRHQRVFYILQFLDPL